jgi:phage tail sheath protein FI
MMTVPAVSSSRLQRVSPACDEEAVAVVTPTLNQGPGVYIQELPNPVLPIVGVPTSVTAFYGQAPQGTVNDPFQVNSWADYENEFGGLDADYPLSYAVYLFFLNGGSTALIVRYDDGTAPASAKLSTDTTLVASSPGAWGGDLSAAMDTGSLYNTDPAVNPNINQFNLTITSTDGSSESYPGVNLVKGTANYLATQLLSSRFVDVAASTIGTTVPTIEAGKTVTVNFTLPAAAAAAGGDAAAGAGAAGAGGGDAAAGGAAAAGAGAAGAGGGDAAAGGAAAAGAGAAGAGAAGAGDAAAGGDGGAGAAAPADTTGSVGLGNSGNQSGIYALLKADIFNILCLPVAPGTTYSQEDLGTAADFCASQRAMLIIDPPPGWTDVPLGFGDVTGSKAALLSPSPNAAVYYPNLQLTDATGASFTAGPCGAVAGVWAATDNTRGVWKAPAGTAAAISGIAGFTVQVDNGESGLLNSLGINTLRVMPAAGAVAWGARTTVGIDQLPNQWKYVPVRRIALYIEESLRRGTLWAVFEPNDEPLWSSLRLNVTTFMQGLFRQGAFAGTTPKDAYLVQCDANNNPPDQVALGIVNILVGFAPLYPAEFVVISIQQQALQD